MLKFNVKDMTCGHCIGIVTNAILKLQDDAEVIASLSDQTVLIACELMADEVIYALAEVGYAATEVKKSCCNPEHTCHV